MTTNDGLLLVLITFVGMSLGGMMMWLYFIRGTLLDILIELRKPAPMTENEYAWRMADELFRLWNDEANPERKAHFAAEYIKLVGSTNKR